MAVKFTDTKYYQEIAEAIRAKTGSTLKMTPSEMATEIGNIPAGGDDNLAKYLKGEAISLDDATVTAIPRYGLASGSTFDGAKIKKLVLPGLKTIGYSGMYNIQFTADAEVDLSGLETIEEYGMACDTAWLTNNPNGLNIAELNFPALKTIGGDAFYNSTGIGSAGTGGLKKITLPAVTRIENYAFRMPNSTSYIATLENIDLPAITYIGSGAFQYQKALRKVSLGNKMYGMGSYAFMYCTSLVEFECPNNSDGNFGESVLGYNPALEYADLGSTGTLDRKTFINDTALKYVIFRKTNRPITGYNDMFSGAGITASTGWILVPSALLENYKTGFLSAYASRFVALQDYTVDGTTTGEIDREKLKTLA